MFNNNKELIRGIASLIGLLLFSALAIAGVL
jgi:hypothetical protein